MTHIAAFLVPESPRPNARKFAVTVADSQGTVPEDGVKFDNVQKLHVVGNNFVMFTGVLDQALFVLEKLNESLEGKNVTPSDLSDKILEIGNNVFEKAPGPAFIVAGQNANDAELYEVDLTRRYGDPRKSQSFGISVNGSGFAETKFLRRDLELGIDRLTDLSEGLIQAFKYGMRAHRNLGCSDKLQIGVIGDGKIRTSFHYGVERNAVREIKLNFDKEFVVPRGEYLEDKVHEQISGYQSVLNDLHTSYLMYCGSVASIDNSAVGTFGLAKYDERLRSEHLREISRLLDKRDIHKRKVDEFSRVLLAGDLKQTVDYLADFDDYRKEARNRALI